MDILALQNRLAAAGHALACDGSIGPVTYGALLGYAAQRKLGDEGVQFGTGMMTAFPEKGIVSDLNVCHWIAQTCHESANYEYLTELGGPGYFARYEGDTDLGNVQPGDGYRFRGRGVLQITGRWNYAHFGTAIGEDLVGDPDLAAQPAIAVAVACQFWKERGIIALADADDVQGVTRKVNGALNGLADREAILARVKAVCGVS
jgi:putative chitinase